MPQAQRIAVDPAGGSTAAPGDAWLTPARVALFAGKTDRHARRLLQTAQDDAGSLSKNWKGLVTREAPPGASHAVEVLASSLPAKVQEAMRRASAPVFPDRKKAVTTDLRWQWKMHIVADALLFPRGSRGRAGALQAASKKRHTNEDTGKSECFSLSTLYAWCKTIESGENPQAPATTGQAKTSTQALVSRAWDVACPLNAVKKRAIADELATFSRSLWRGAFNGWRICASHATTKLVELCRAAGWSDADLKNCQVPRRFVDRQDIRVARELAILEKDAGGHYSTREPRVRRSRNGIMPWEIVCLDVHPLDIIIQREDGSEATPRLITWLDIATGLSFNELVLCEKNKGIRQTHIISSFKNLVLRHGLPKIIQIDNGSENKNSAFQGGFSMLRDIAHAFKEFCSRLRAEDQSINLYWCEESGADGAAQPDFMIARPHHPASKPVERFFAMIESRMRPLDGYIGGDRMVKRTHKKGAAPRAFDGTFEELKAIFDDAVKVHNNQPAGDDKKSPFVRLAELQARARVDPSLYRPPAVGLATLAYAMATEKKLQIRTDGLWVDGVRYFSDGLLRACSLRTVHVRVPAFDAGLVFVRFPDSEVWEQVGRDRDFDYQDRDGAREQARRKGVQRAGLASVALVAPKVNATEEMRRHAAALPDEPAPLKGAHISLVGKEIAPSPALPASTKASDVPVLPNEAPARLPASAPIRPRVELSPEDMAALRAKRLASINNAEREES